jgi:hypothetical protein
VRNDNEALTWLQSAKVGTTKLRRWTLQQQQIDLDLQHCPGKESELPDFLSGNPAPKKPDEILGADDTNDAERLLPPERRRYRLESSPRNLELNRGFKFQLHIQDQPDCE